MAPEHPAVHVQLVHHDVAQLLEQLEPLRVVGEDPGMEHVRVGDDDLARAPDGRPDRPGGVPVVRGGRDAETGRGRQLGELRHLVLPERLGGEQEQGAGGRIVRDGLERGDRVAQRLARGGWRHDHHVMPGVHRLHGLGLVGVQPVDPARGEARGDARVQPARQGREDGRARRHRLVMDDPACERWLREQVAQDSGRIERRVGSHRVSRRYRTDVRFRDGTANGAACACHLVWHTLGGFDTSAARS